MIRIPQNRKQTHEVFGVSPEVLRDSYVDRGDLDEEIRRLLERPVHLALRGVSKSGKSWLRQTVLPEAIVVQCRLGKSVLDIYRETLGELGIRLEVSSVSESSLKGTVESSAETGIRLIAKVQAKLGLDYTKTSSTTTHAVSQDIHDLRFVADLILESKRRLVVEDFHYLSLSEREKFAFDLKALWDYGVFVIIVGVWSKGNMLLFLNPDLSARIREIPIVWTEANLREVLRKGGEALNISFSEDFQRRAIDDCYQNVGILQRVILDTLDRIGLVSGQKWHQTVGHIDSLMDAELFYAEELNSLYQVFASRVSTGIRRRQNATGIYGHLMAVVLEASDPELILGMSLDRIYVAAHAREKRIQKGNLQAVLEKIESLQVDDDGRGLVVAYNERDKEVSVVDLQLLLYRKYSTVSWPWEDLIREALKQGELFTLDGV